MKETGKVRMLEIYWGDSKVKCQWEMKVSAKLFVKWKEKKCWGKIALTVIYTHVGLDIMRKPEERNAF